MNQLTITQYYQESMDSCIHEDEYGNSLIDEVQVILPNPVDESIYVMRCSKCGKDIA